jgi:hypothetical protein
VVGVDDGGLVGAIVGAGAVVAAAAAGFVGAAVGATVAVGTGAAHAESSTALAETTARKEFKRTGKALLVGSFRPSLRKSAASVQRNGSGTRRAATCEFLLPLGEGQDEGRSRSWISLVERPSP